MGWKGLGMGIQSGWGTMGRGHNGTGTEWELDTIERGHSVSERDGHGDTLELRHNGTGTQWVEKGRGWGYNVARAQWDGGTMGRGHY